MDPIHKMLATWHTHTFAMHRGDEGYLRRLLPHPPLRIVDKAVVDDDA